MVSARRNTLDNGNLAYRVDRIEDELDRQKEQINQLEVEYSASKASLDSHLENVAANRGMWRRVAICLIVASIIGVFGFLMKMSVMVQSARAIPSIEQTRNER